MRKRSIAGSSRRFRKSDHPSPRLRARAGDRRFRCRPWQRCRARHLEIHTSPCLHRNARAGHRHARNEDVPRRRCDDRRRACTSTRRARCIALSRSRSSRTRALQIHETIYPPPTSYHFKPLNEDVLVYETPFRLTLDITPGWTPRQREILRTQDRLTIKGQLTYQACDDKVCYLPASVPFEWGVRIAR